MVGRCKYCDFIGTNDEMEEHARECPVMLEDHQPDDPKILGMLDNFWFSRFVIPICIALLSWILVIGVLVKVTSKIYKKFKIGGKHESSG